MISTKDLALSHSARIVELGRPDRRFLGGATWSFVAFEFRRFQTRQSVLLGIVLPAVLYLALAHVGDSNPSLPHGDFSTWMMIGIAVYGAAASAVSGAAGISVERASGWMRTVRLSPVHPVAYVVIKVVASILSAALPVGVVGAIAALTGAQAEPQVWATSLVAAWLGSGIFAALGLFLGLTFPPEIMMHIPGILMTALAFLGNLFLPLSGAMLQVAQWTPMYGVVTVARYALTEGNTFSGEATPLLGAVINLIIWFVIFVLAAARQFSRSTGRQ